MGVDGRHLGNKGGLVEGLNAHGVDEPSRAGSVLYGATANPREQGQK